MAAPVTLVFGCSSAGLPPPANSVCISVSPYKKINNLQSCCSQDSKHFEHSQNSRLCSYFHTPRNYVQHTTPPAIPHTLFPAPSLTPNFTFCGIPCQTAAGVPISATATASNYTCYGTMPVPYPDTASGPDPSTIKSPTSSVAPIFWHQPQSL